MSGACPACASGRTEAFLDLGTLPVFANVHYATEGEARAAACAPFELARCLECGLVFNARFEPDRVEYSAHYENSQQFSPRFVAHLDGVVDQLAVRWPLQRGPVVELGCGDGFFLDRLCAKGATRGIGFDPAAPNAAPSTRVTLHRTAFDRTAVDAPPSLVAFRHVLEHVWEPRAFLDMVRREFDGAFGLYCEVPDARFTLEDGGVWDLLYEHCHYFTDGALVRLMTSAGFDVVACDRQFGGQFLGLEAAAGGSTTKSLAAPSLAWLEPAVATFRTRFDAIVSSWAQRLARLKADGRRAVLWGAGTKGVMFAHLVPGAADLPGLVDVSPRKQGRHIPGTGQPVLSPDDLVTLRPDVVVVMNSVYRDEIERDLNARGLVTEVCAADDDV